MDSQLCDLLNLPNQGGVVVGERRGSVTEHWQLKPEAPGSIPGVATFLSFPLPFQRSSDSNGPDYL